MPFHLELFGGWFTSSTRQIGTRPHSPWKLNIQGHLGSAQRHDLFLFTRPHPNASLDRLYSHLHYTPLTDVLGRPKYLALTDSVRQPQTYLLNGTESKKRYGIDTWNLKVRMFLVV